MKGSLRDACRIRDRSSFIVKEQLMLMVQQYIYLTMLTFETRQRKVGLLRLGCLVMVLGDAGGLA